MGHKSYIHWKAKAKLKFKNFYPDNCILENDIIFGFLPYNWL